MNMLSSVWFIIYIVLLLLALIFASSASDNPAWAFLALLIATGLIFGFGYQTASGYPVDINKMKAGQEYTVISIGESLGFIKRQKFQYLVLEAEDKIVTFRASGNILPSGLAVGDTVMRSTKNEIRITKSFAQGKG